jgi:hypothetical protein
MLCKERLRESPLGLQQVAPYRPMCRKTRFAEVALSLLFVFSFAGWSAAANAAQSASDESVPKQITLAEYRQELSRIDEQLKALVQDPQRASDLRTSIPEEWDVQTSSGNFDLNNEDLRYKLGRYASSPKDRGEILPEMELRVETQLEGAKQFDHLPDASVRNKLDAILEAREYGSVSHTQSAMEKLKDLALAWVIRVLSRFYRAAAAHSQFSKIVLWSIIGLVILSFAVWMYLLLRRATRDEYTYGPGGTMLFHSHKHWQQWLREARASAERGDWREAVHLAYWTGISYLESNQAWKPDPARTPREYVRILADPVRREPLEALTRRFEFVWYAQRSASSEDFQFSLAKLDEIGCR